jgi:glyoxylase-like metal-dependent hydrolase (beta-lactamase superfamily II)
MARLLQLFALVLGVGIAALYWTFTADNLPVPAPPPLTPPAAMTTQGVELKAILAGKMLSRAAMAYRGGSLTEERVFNMGGILVQHPKGTLLFDTGFGSAVDQQFRMTPWLMQQTARYEKEPTVAAQLQTAGIALPSLTGVYLTHAHWDHVSGLVDLPNVPVYVPQAELDFINSGDPATALARQIGTQSYKVYNFEGRPYLGFDKSHDVFGDGAVVIVPAPGHTPGSIFAFITTSAGQHYVLVGDTAWQSENVDLPAEKPWLSRTLVDKDPDNVRALLIKLHQLKEQMPDLIIVPAHDRRVWEKLPKLLPQ